MKNKSEAFNNYKSMKKSAKNWDIHCAYQLHPNALIGEHRVEEFQTLQLSYTKREGGFMHNAISPKDTFSVAIILQCASKACFDVHKLYKGKVLFFDDDKAYNFMSESSIEVGIISISKLKYPQLCEYLSHYLGFFIDDKEEILSSIFQKTKNKEQDILFTLTNFVKKYSPRTSKITKGESIALSIRDEVYQHMDGEISISAFAKKYNVHSQTLQNSFKSLFGFTPKLFLRLLKLNLVHYELENTDPKTATVSNIARKWGFTHMGRFSNYYSKLFLEKPSTTLKKVIPNVNGIESKCVVRQEEI